MSFPNGSPRRQKGYWRLAREYMYSNNHAAIFSRCSDLIIFDLLLMQAQLFEARKRFGLPVNGFGSSSDGSSSSLSTATAWTDLLEGGELSKDMKEWCELRPLLRDYQNTLLQAIQLAEQPWPELYNLHVVQGALDNGFVDMPGADEHVYKDEPSQGQEPARDIIALRRGMVDDPLSKAIAKRFIPRLNKIFDRVSKSGKFSESRLKTYSAQVILFVGSTTTTFLAAGYLVGVTVLLYKIASMTTRLLIIVVFSLVYAFLLSFFKAPGVEAFSAISTFAAVEVIFISNNVSSSSTSTVMSSSLNSTLGH